MISFGKASRGNNVGSDVPGPGSYAQIGMNEDNVKHGKGFTMKQKFTDLKVDPVPGPGAYNSTYSDKGNLISFGKEAISKEYSN